MNTTTTTKETAMTRKHYIAIAKTFNEVAHENIDSDTWRTSVEAIAAMLKADNANFNRAKFLNACGWEYVFGVSAS